MNWHKRYRAMKKGLGLTNSSIAEITGNTADSVKTSTQPNKELPRWVKLSIVIYERLSDPKADVSNFVLLAKPNYKAKDGNIKRGIEIEGKYYAPKNDC